MFQMMNEARIMVGLNGVATASVAYHESLAYARTRTQGRTLAGKSASLPQVPLVEHADVRRMLLRQKAIVEGGLALVAFTAKQADLSEHATDEAVRDRATLLLGVLTPIAKTFPAEWGFESNALAVQIHGGYGYSSEQLPEAWLREQKLNSIHEGTTGIQALDLLGRKVVARGGAALLVLLEETNQTIARAEAAGLDKASTQRLRDAVRTVNELTALLGAIGLGGDVDAMLRHATDFLSLFAITVVSWLLLWQAAIAKEALARDVSDADRAFYEGKLCTADYFLATELPRVTQLATLCRTNETSYARMREAWF
jgi:butyryl-CoA dehydrogenase